MAQKPMTKSDILSHFSKKFELTKKIASGIAAEVASLAVSETKKIGSFTIPGIGKLVLAKRKARTGRNPATGKPIKISAKTVVKMRVGRAAKQAIVAGRKREQRIKAIPAMIDPMGTLLKSSGRGGANGPAVER